MDRLPTEGCQDAGNLTLLHRCDPYHPRFFLVGRERIFPVSKRRKIRNIRHLPSVTQEAVFERQVSLNRLVERYIRYSERVREHRDVKRNRVTGTVVEKGKAPETGRKRPESISGEKKSEAKPQYAEIQEEREGNVSATRASTAIPASPRGVAVPGQKSPKEEHNASGPLGISHIVKKGETFFGLARKYRTSVYDILRWNGFKRGHILKTGENLTIYPGEKTELPVIKKAEIRATYGTYTVRKGDTLTGICRMFSVKRKELCRINGMERNAFLKTGEKISMPLSQKQIDLILEQKSKGEQRLEKSLNRKEKIKNLRKNRYRLKYTGDRGFKHKMRVIATAYTSHRSQTDRTPFLAAWNNRIRPGMKIIAVSPDLIRKYGITNGTKVKISGLPGIYTVRDKMNKRLRNHIDIYMGTNHRKAIRWGRRRVVLYW